MFCLTCVLSPTEAAITLADRRFAEYVAAVNQLCDDTCHPEITGKMIEERLPLDTIADRLRALPPPVRDGEPVDRVPAIFGQHGGGVWRVPDHPLLRASGFDPTKPLCRR